MQFGMGSTGADPHLCLVLSHTQHSLPYDTSASHTEFITFFQTLHAFVSAWKALLSEVFVDHLSQEWLTRCALTVSPIYFF